MIKKIKKIRKKLYIKIEKRQRGNRAIQKGDGLFISLEALCGLSWLKNKQYGYGMDVSHLYYGGL